MAEFNITMRQKNASGELDTYYPKTIATQVVEDTDHQFVSTAKKTQYDSNTVYTNATPIVEAIGGVEAGETFENTPVNEMLTKILYPYIKPVIVSATATPGSKVAELGTTVAVTEVVAVVSKKSQAITSVALYNGATLVENKTADVAAGGSIAFTSGVSLTANATLTVKVTDAKGTVVESDAAKYTFVNPIYHGSIADGTALTQDVVKGLAKDIVVKGTRTYTETFANKCLVVAYPASYGDLKSAKDANGFDNLPSYAKSVVSVTGTDGVAVNYNVYVKTVASGTNFAMTYAFA